MFDLREEQERVILVGVQENGGANAEESLDELAELASTAGAKVEGRLVQVREAIHPGTYIGKGKLEELKILVRACDATDGVPASVGRTRLGVPAIPVAAGRCRRRFPVPDRCG